MNYDSTRRDASHPASGRRAIFNGSAGDVHYYWAVDGAPYESRFAHPGAWKRGRKTRRSSSPSSPLQSPSVLASPQYAYNGRTGKVTAHVVPLWRGRALLTCPPSLQGCLHPVVFLLHSLFPPSRPSLLGTRLRSSMCH